MWQWRAMYKVAVQGTRTLGAGALKIVPIYAMVIRCVIQPNGVPVL